MTVAALQCSHPGCVSIAEPTVGTEAGLCARHRQQARQARGACLNCGGGLDASPELNQLTGRPLMRGGVACMVYKCAAGCGYTRRSRAPKRK